MYETTGVFYDFLRYSAANLVRIVIVTGMIISSRLIVDPAMRD